MTDAAKGLKGMPEGFWLDDGYRRVVHCPTEEARDAAARLLRGECGKPVAREHSEPPARKTMCGVPLVRPGESVIENLRSWLDRNRHDLARWEERWGDFHALVTEVVCEGHRLAKELPGRGSAGPG